MKYAVLLTFFLSSSFIFSQSDSEDEKGNLFFGLNIGGYQSNNKMAWIYNGNVTPFTNVQSYFSNPFNKAELDNYFKYEYKIESFATPDLMRYRTALNIGGHAGIKLSKYSSVYADVNLLQLKVEDFFTVAINNPNDPTTVGDTYEQIPILGEESRTNINIGLQSNFYTENELTAYFNFFGNVNNTRLEKNYFVINNKVYTITHNAEVNGTTNGFVNYQQRIKPSGIGFGGGAGLGIKYKFNDKFTFDANYYAIYTRTNINTELNFEANLKPFGLNHALVARIIWG